MLLFAAASCSGREQQQYQGDATQHVEQHDAGKHMSDTVSNP